MASLLELITVLEEEHNKLYVLQNQLKIQESVINSLKQKIYNTCEHKWIIDSSSTNEHTEYICAECNFTK